MITFPFEKKVMVTLPKDNEITSDTAIFKELFLDSSVTYSDAISKLYDHSPLDPSKIKTIYFAPHITVSREKAKSFLSAHGITKVSSPTLADAVIVSASTFWSELTRKYVRLCSIEACRKFLILVNKYSLEYSRYLDAVEKEYPNAQMNINAMFEKQHKYSNVLEFAKEQTEITSICIIADNPAFLNSDNDFSKFYSDKFILSLIGDTVIDSDTEKGIAEMFQSSDKSNHTVAMTIMANCNFTQSFPSLVNLLEKYHVQIHNTKYRNSVAFKGLLIWFSNMPLDRLTSGNLSRILIKNGAATEVNVAVIKQRFLDEVHAMNPYFTIDATATEELLSLPSKPVSLIEEPLDYVERLSSGTELL